MRLDRPAEPAAYLPFSQAATAGKGAAGSLDLRLVVRSDNPLSSAQPLRAALTGRTTSPPIFDVLAVLGKSESLARLQDQAVPTTASD